MSDPYSEATRSDRGGRSRIIFLLGGGFLATLLIAVILWMNLSAPGHPGGPPEPLVEADFRLAAARVAAARAVAADAAPPERRRLRLVPEIADGRALAEATAELWAEVEAEDGISIVAVEEGSEFALEMDSPGLSRTRTSRHDGIERYLEPAKLGENAFGTMGPGLPDWVPTYPGARGVVHGPQTSSFYPGSAAFLVADRAEHVVDWYEQVAEFMSQGGPSSSAEGTETVKTVRKRPDGAVRERFAMKWGDRLMTLVATEDDFGGTLFFILFMRRDA